jgi:hypothetical protein
MRRGRQEELQKQFCISVELGDHALVRDLIQRGVNTGMRYSVDGKTLTPIQSALSRGDVSMSLELLNSRSTKLNYEDLLNAPPLKRREVTPFFVEKLCQHLDPVTRSRIQQMHNKSQRDSPRMGQKVSLTESISTFMQRERQGNMKDNVKPMRKPNPPPYNVSSTDDDEASYEDTEQEDEKMEDACPPGCVKAPDQNADDEDEDEENEDSGSSAKMSGESDGDQDMSDDEDNDED